MPRTTRFDSWIENRSANVQDLLLEWSRLGFGDDEEATAQLVARHLTAEQFDDVEVFTIESSGANVFARRHRSGSEAAHVLLVGLHDVPWLDGGDPADVLADEKGLIGPGIASRFAPFLAHTEAFHAMADASGGLPPVNLSVLMIDSTSLGTHQLRGVVRHLDLGALDVIVAVPSVAWDMRAPTVTLGARGELLVEIVAGTGRDLQVNTFAGSSRNPLQALTKVISKLRDSKGRIAIPGFYNRAVPPTTAERNALSREGYDPTRWIVGTGASVLSGGPSALERASAWPALEVVSVRSGADHRMRSQTVPGSASAMINVSLVRNQRPAEIAASLNSWLDGQRSPGIELSLNVIAQSEPYVVERDNPWLLSQARAAKRLFNGPPIPVLGGGTPGLAEISTLLDVPMLFSGIASPASFAGTVHERLSHDRLRLATNLVAEMWEQFVKRAARLGTD